MSQKIKKTCPIKHVNFYIVKHDDGTHKVKCVNANLCGDSCPYMKDPDYKYEYKRAPDFKTK